MAQAFGASGDARGLAGGSGASWLIGDVVPKPIEDPAETPWVQALTERIDSDRFGVAQPIQTATGRDRHSSRPVLGDTHAR